MRRYADKEYYANAYHCGADVKIAGPKFDQYAMRATKEIRARTFGNIKEDAELQDEVRMCCCEVAEKLYDADCAKGENGMVLQSYSNDGDSGSFQASEMTAEGVSAAIDGIVRSWLLDIGLMYCGVRR